MDKLARDVREALRLGYGCSYGRYKADHPNTADHVVDVIPDPEQHEKFCKCCGVTFYTKRSDRHFCTEECRIKYNRRKYIKMQNEVKLPLGPAECITCGKTYNRYKHSQTCCRRRCAGMRRGANKRIQQMGD